MLCTALKSFFVVARLGSVTLAAKQLGLSQSTVTTQIRQLESNYGVELFHRAGRRFSLSDAGVGLMPLAGKLVQQETEADFYLRDSGELRYGNLRVGATSPYYILDLISRFRNAHPGVEVSLEIGNSLQVIEALHEYRVDVAASSLVVNDKSLERVTLGEDPLVLMVNRRHALAGRDVVPITVLTECCLLLREQGSTTRGHTETMLTEAGIVPLATLEIGSRESIREAVVRNMGVSVIAAHEVPTHPDIRVLHFTDATTLIGEYLYCLKERSQARLMLAFIRHANALR